MRANSSDFGRSNDRWARVVLGIALVASAAFLFHYRSEIGFVFDDWWFIRDRSTGGIDTLLDAHNEHIVVFQVGLYRIFFSLFGVGSAVPLHILSLGVFLSSIVALFIYLRDQVGEPVAALASISVLFMGTAYYDLLWTFQIGYSLSILGGLIALIALSHDGRFSRPVACLALIVAVTSSSLGLPFIVGVAVLLLHSDGRKFWRNYALLVPSLMYLLWYLFEGRKAPNYVSFENLLGVPAYVFESLKSVAMGLTGIHALPSPLDDTLGVVATAVLMVSVIAYLWRRKSMPVPLTVGLAVGLTFWVLIALNQPGLVGRPADSSRYQYPGAVFLLMILAGAFAGTKLRKSGVLALAGLVSISIVAGLASFSDGARQLRWGADISLATVTAFGLAGDQAVPGVELTLVPYFDSTLDREQYLAIKSRHGMPQFSNEEIPGLDEDVRTWLDSSLIAVLGLDLKAGSPAKAGRCRTAGQGQGDPALLLERGTVTFSPRGSTLEVRLGRFAAGTQRLGLIPAGQTRALTIPEDNSEVPWKIETKGQGRARICVTGPPG